MRLFWVAAMIALLAGSAFAQDHVQRAGEPDPEKRPQEIEADKARDKAYNNSLSNIPDRGPVDPWGSTRATDAPKPSAKATAKVVSKTSATKPKPKPAVTPN